MKKKIVVIAMAATVMLTGCGASVPDLSNVDNNVAAQYVADALLQNDKNYDESLEYDHSILEATPTPEPTAAPAVATPEVSQNPTDGTNTQGDGASVSNQPGSTNAQSVATPAAQSVSLTDIFGASGIEVKETAYRVKQSYGTDYAVCTAKKGKKLLAVQFCVTNTTKSTKKVDFLRKKLDIELLINNESYGAPLMSIVDEDLQFFNKKIGAQKKKQGVLLFEIDKTVDVSSVAVKFTKGQKEANVAVY